MAKKALQKERYQFIISSAADARKKPVAFSLSKSMVIFLIILSAIIIAVAAWIAALFIVKNEEYSSQINQLNQKIEEQSAMLHSYSKELTDLQNTVKTTKNTSSERSSVTSSATVTGTFSMSGDPSPSPTQNTQLTKNDLIDLVPLEKTSQSITDQNNEPLANAAMQTTDNSPKVNGQIQLIDWFNGGSNLFPRYARATVIDVLTGLRFNVQRFGGDYHADSTPLTKEDTATFLAIYGGEWSWDRRPIILQIGDQYVAASMNGMPHMVDANPDDDFPGHFCIHFWHSRVHETEAECPRHQECVLSAFENGNSIL